MPSRRRKPTRSLSLSVTSFQQLTRACQLLRETIQMSRLPEASSATGGTGPERKRAETTQKEAGFYCPLHDWSALVDARGPNRCALPSCKCSVAQPKIPALLHGQILFSLRCRDCRRLGLGDEACRGLGPNSGGTEQNMSLIEESKETCPVGMQSTAAPRLVVSRIHTK